jgi:hypothetical protein
VQAENYYGTQLALETMLGLGFKATVLNLLLSLYLADFVFVLLDWMTEGANSSCRD